MTACGGTQTSDLHWTVFVQLSGRGTDLNWALMLLGLEERLWASFSCFSLRILSDRRKYVAVMWLYLFVSSALEQTHMSRRPLRGSNGAGNMLQVTHSVMASRSAMSPSTMRWMMLLCSSSDRFLWEMRGVLHLVAGEGSTPRSHT